MNQGTGSGMDGRKEATLKNSMWQWKDQLNLVTT